MTLNFLTIGRVAGLIACLLLGVVSAAWADIIHDGGTVTGHAVWYASDNDHIVTGSISIAGDASLTIQAGCVVRFEHGVNISVSGTLNTAGTPSDGVLMTRRDPTDEWYGLWFYPDSGGTLEYTTIEYVTRYDGYAIYANGSLPSIEHCTIRYNDYGLYLNNVDAPTLAVANTFTENNAAGIAFNNCSSASVANQTLTGHTAARGAIYLSQCGPFHIGAGNAVTANSWGLTVDVGSYPDPASDGHIPLAGNTNDDGIQVSGGSCTGTTIWHDVGADFILTTAPSVAGSGTLTVDAGVTVRFEHGVNISVSGTLNTAGTPSDGVLMTRRDPTDEWYGLWYYPDASGSLEYTTVEYVTRYDGYAIYSQTGNLDLTHCILRYNDYGFRAQDASPHFLNCQITENNNYGIFLNGACTPTFGSSLAEWNDIHSNGGGALDRDFHNGTEDIYARYIYWGTVTATEIQDCIHHEPDDDLLGLVVYSPWINADHDEVYEGGGAAVEGEDPEVTEMPTAYGLAQNAPNPFNPRTEIHYTLPQASPVVLSVFDLSGRRIATLVNGFEEAGFKTVSWDARQLGSGTYLYRIEAGSFVQTRKMTLLR